MSEYIDNALDCLANGADANQRLTLESILRTGLHYMSDDQITRTRLLCSAALCVHGPQPAYVTGMRQMHPGQSGKGHNSADSRTRRPDVAPRTGPIPGETGYDS